MALCYIAKIQKQQCSKDKVYPRLFIITGSDESTLQYMTYMNVFFTAQKEKILIDVCSLDKNLHLLQQGCDITGGQYLRLAQLDGLLQYFLWAFLPDPATRAKLILPPVIQIDYRSACFCHRQLVNMGYVCSVCLSIFCKFSPICTTCHTVYNTTTPINPKQKKKKRDTRIN